MSQPAPDSNPRALSGGQSLVWSSAPRAVFSSQSSTPLQTTQPPHPTNQVSIRALLTKTDATFESFSQKIELLTEEVRAGKGKVGDDSSQSLADKLLDLKYDIESFVGESRASVDASLNALQLLLQNISTRVQEIEGRLTTIDQRLEMVADIDISKSKLSTMGQHLDGLTTQVGQVLSFTSTLAPILSSMQDMPSHVRSLKHEVKELEEMRLARKNFRTCLVTSPNKTGHTSVASNQDCSSNATSAPFGLLTQATSQTIFSPDSTLRKGLSPDLRPNTTIQSSPATNITSEGAFLYSTAVKHDKASVESSLLNRTTHPTVSSQSETRDLRQEQVLLTPDLRGRRTTVTCRSEGPSAIANRRLSSAHSVAYEISDSGLQECRQSPIPEIFSNFSRRKTDLYGVIEDTHPIQDSSGHYLQTPSLARTHGSTTFLRKRHQAAGPPPLLQRKRSLLLYEQSQSGELNTQSRNKKRGREKVRQLTSIETSEKAVSYVDW
ncbi:hypothetical protein FRC03_006670 [Tulasnella sp. 419]|nr:hypothetical protein FRC03_006670 [Tulasnella sp. 419]